LLLHQPGGVNDQMILATRNEFSGDVTGEINKNVKSVRGYMDYFFITPHLPLTGLTDGEPIGDHNLGGLGLVCIETMTKVTGQVAAQVGIDTPEVSNTMTEVYLDQMSRGHKKKNSAALNRAAEFC
jgi:hypothetical protein